VRSLAHAPLNDAVAAWDWRGRCGDDGGGGVAAFSTLTGDLRHCFRVAHGRQPRSFTAGALAFSWGAGGRAPDLRGVRWQSRSKLLASSGKTKVLGGTARHLRSC